MKSLALPEGFRAPGKEVLASETRRSLMLRVPIAGLALTTVLAGCVHEPQARPVIAPDGEPAYHVSCGSDQGACFALAGDACPYGYRLKPIFDEHHFLVRCMKPVPPVEAAPSLMPGVVITQRIQERLADAPVNTAAAFIPSLGAPLPPPGQRWTPGSPWRPPFRAYYREPRSLDESSPYAATEKPDIGY